MENSFSILIIEDDVLLNDMTKRLLTQHGYCVTSAYSGSEALLLIEKSSFDICAEGFKTGTIFNFRHITSPSYIV